MAKDVSVPAKGEGPFGISQTKLFKWILSHPKCNLREIHEGLFNDKKTAYVSNLIGENRDYITITKFDNQNMPSQYQIKMDVIGLMIDIKQYVETGKFKTLANIEV